jgi:beta-glucosidase
MPFPEHFVWGAAAASYQIEGAAYDDGKGLSVWDQMSHWPGKIPNGETGDVACDHYHRYRDDVALMGEMGLRAYRFSISWPRVLPEGIGAVNQAGIGFYDRLVDALLEEEIEPWITLFHWDYPVALFNRGGWLNRDSADWFADYTRVVVDALSDRVTHWMPQNELQCFIGAGHQTGRHAPGLRLDMPSVLLAAHHALLAHGRSVQAIRARARKEPQVGTALVGVIKMPATGSPADIDAARRATMSVAGPDMQNNTWFADPLFLGGYPADGLELFGAQMPAIPDGDMGIICQPPDFYGFNTYSGETVRATGDGSWASVTMPAGAPLTTMDWHVTPDVLYWGPRFFFERYGRPVVITENGMANCDWVQQDGRVHDPQRIDFLRRYIQAVGAALDDAIDVKGYFVWSVMDNFEWGHGYKQRFGLVYVDYETQARTLKDSAYWYRDVIATNGAILSKG